jgi:hypothetical protein
MVYKRPHTIQVEGMRSISPSSHELLEYSAHPMVTLFFCNINPLDIGLLPLRRGLNQDRSLCASLFMGPPQNQKRAILTILLFVGAENTAVYKTPMDSPGVWYHMEDVHLGDVRPRSAF